VSAQGAAVGATVGIDGDLAASQRVLQKNIRTICHVGTLRNKYIWIIQIKLQEFLSSPIDKTAYSTVFCSIKIRSLTVFSLD
jgi:hypothetical protein